MLIILQQLTGASIRRSYDGRYIQLDQISKPPASPATKDEQAAGLCVIHPGRVLPAEQITQHTKQGDVLAASYIPVSAANAGQQGAGRLLQESHLQPFYPLFPSRPLEVADAVAGSALKLQDGLTSHTVPGLTR